MPASFWSLNSWGQDIIDPFYAAFTGKVGPFTTKILIDDCITQQLQASGLDPTDENNRASIAGLCESQTKADIADSEKQPPPKPDCNNPGSDILVNLNCAIKKIESVIIIVLILAIAIYLGGQYLKGRGGR